jgi:hypothetical protein
MNIMDYHYYVFCRTSLIFYYVYENGGVPTQFQNVGILANSFFPSTIRSWNKLSPQLRNAPTLNRFKQANRNHTIKPRTFYIAGCRILNIIHTRLRHRSSSGVIAKSRTSILSSLRKTSLNFNSSLASL